MPVPKELGKRYTEKGTGKPLSYFDRRSLRWKRSPAKGALKAYILVGCKKGRYDAKRGVCRIGTEAYKIATKRKAANPYPLLIATVNPSGLDAIIKKYGRKYGETSTSAALKEFRQRYGKKAVIQSRIVDIPGVKKQILIGRGSLDRIDYTHNVKGSRIPNEPHTHEQGDTGNRKIRPANTYLADTVGGKVTIAVSNRKHVNKQGYYNG